jgi:hypothetical protein
MKQTIHVFFLLLVTIMISSPAATGQPVASASLRPPETIEFYHKLFDNVRALTGFPFTLFPGLGGADKTKFIADDLINRDELVHTMTYLQGQYFIALAFSPDTAKELQATLTICEFLRQRFYRIASQRDAQGNLAISEGDIEAMFAAPVAERSRSQP